MQNWSQCYQKIGSLPAVSASRDVWLSPATNDPWWDDFLRRTPWGQYQQSSLWAEFKAGDGWSHHRLIITGDSGITGGFQILWQQRGPGRIGYVSKGPVAHPESTHLHPALTALLVRTARELGLNALISQRPDDAPRDEATQVETLGFIQSNPMKVVEATYLVEVQEEMDVLRSKMSPSLRRNLRKARKNNGVIREGTESDLPLFFELMAATCRRQLTQPNPASVAALRRLWSIFSPSHSIRVTLAECSGATPAAKLSLIFGQLVTVWKKGWDGSHASWHPNELLEDEALEWTKKKGYRACDFCSFDRFAAERILGGIPVPGGELSSRDEYHVRFGGRPKPLPRAHLLLPNPILRWAYRNSYVRFERSRERRLPGNTA